MRAVPVTEQYRAWIGARDAERKPLVTLRNTPEGRLSLSEVLLAAYTSRPVGKAENFVRQPLACLFSAWPSGRATRRSNLLSTLSAPPPICCPSAGLVACPDQTAAGALSIP